MSKHTQRHHDGRHPGFTLVELLTVILIIGILAALVIPAVQVAITRAKTAAMRTEVEGLSQAIEAYNTKYGDYPPDFSDWGIVNRHYRKIFPNINTTELSLLLSMCSTGSPAAFSPTAMDRAEALVWNLGGFSSDPEHPFTGTGGPLDDYIGSGSTAAANYQYNLERDNALFDFDVDKLGLYFNNDQSLSDANHVMSTDDAGTGTFGDWFPVYRGEEEYAPFVYFDKRTYDLYVSGSDQWNGWAPFTPSVENGGYVRPYFSAQANPKSGTGAYGSATAAIKGWRFANPKTFQVIGPGIDGIYGSLAEHPTADLPLYFQYPTGNGVVPLATATNPNELLVTEINGYIETGLVSSIVDNYQLDNVTNFSSGALENDVEE